MKIKQHPYRIVCDICASRDTYMIERPGIPISQCPTLCKKDLIDLIKTGMEIFKDEIELTMPDDCEQLKAEVERLKIELEASETEIKRLSVNAGKCEAAESTDNMSRTELLSLAKELGVEGRYTTLKTAELVEKIREAQKK